MSKKLAYRYSAMAAGKSLHLLGIAFNYEQLNKAVLLLTAQIDDRFGVGQIASRMGVSRSAEMFTASTDLYTQLADFVAEHRGPLGDSIGAVLVDEAQFLSKEQVKQLHRAVHTLSVPVICFGLRSDFKGEPFEGAAMLLTLAEDIEELKNVCACGSKATMNMRVDAEGKRVQDGPQVLIGDATYRAVCAKCFYRS